MQEGIAGVYQDIIVSLLMRSRVRTGDLEVSRKVARGILTIRWGWNGTRGSGGTLCSRSARTERQVG